MNILLLESDSDLASTLTIVIEQVSSKNKVTVIETPEEMFYCLEHFQYPLIILELLTLDGFAHDFFKYIKKFDKKPKIIFITHQEEAPIDSVKLLKKPFDLEEFEQLIDFVPQ
jgi:DNA-binding response OmpR family regulator